MTVTTLPRAQPPADGFCHEALFYAGDDGFLSGTVPFIESGVEAEEPVLVVVSAHKIAQLRDALGDTADRVLFADMARVGTNPARIIPAWRRFVVERTTDGRRARGIGEPISAERTAAELVECQRHEELLNLAFAATTAWWLLCPYDTAQLRPDVLAEAERSHHYVLESGAHRPSGTYAGLAPIAAPFAAPLPDPPSTADQLAFGAGPLEAVRRFIERHAEEFGLSLVRAHDLVLAVNELVTNSVRHGGGGGDLRVWRDGDVLVCEVRDMGHIEEPLVGREPPPEAPEGGRGIWLVNQLCDLVQLRSFPAGTVVRLHMRAG